MHCSVFHKGALNVCYNGSQRKPALCKHVIDFFRLRLTAH